jgi:hypothetical protein
MGRGDHELLQGEALQGFAQGSAADAEAFAQVVLIERFAALDLQRDDGPAQSAISHVGLGCGRDRRLHVYGPLSLSSLDISII